VADSQKSLVFDKKVREHKAPKSIHDLISRGDDPPVRLQRPTQEQVTAWRQEHPGGSVLEKLRIRIGYPTKEVIEVPCMIAIRYHDHVLVLNVDGKTHRFYEGEFEE